MGGKLRLARSLKLSIHTQERWLRDITVQLCKEKDVSSVRDLPFLLPELGLQLSMLMTYEAKNIVVHLDQVTG
jgi:hypothetical protein